MHCSDIASLPVTVPSMKKNSEMVTFDNNLSNYMCLNAESGQPK